MAVLLIAEVAGGVLNADATGKALAAVAGLGDVTVLCASTGCSGAADDATKLDGVSKVLCADDAAYGNDLAEPVADLIVSLAGDFDHIAAPSTAASKNILPRVAALLDAMVISEVTAVIDTDTFDALLRVESLRKEPSPTALLFLVSTMAASRVMAFGVSLFRWFFAFGPFGPTPRATTLRSFKRTAMRSARMRSFCSSVISPGDVWLLV